VLSQGLQVSQHHAVGPIKQGHEPLHDLSYRLPHVPPELAVEIAPFPVYLDRQPAGIIGCRREGVAGGGGRLRGGAGLALWL